MEAHHLPLSSLITLSFLAILPPSYCTDDARFVECSRPYECGRIKNVSYPFWGGDRPEYCGRQGFKLECNYYEYTIIKFEELEFLVLNINESQNNMTIARWDLWHGFCPQTYLDTVFNYSIFDYASTVQNITLFYHCPPQVNTLISVQNRFTCPWKGGNNNAYFVNESSAKIQIPGLEQCREKIRVPILRNAIDESAGVIPALQEALNRGFDVDYNPLHDTACSGCEHSGGHCGSNVTHQFVCFCPDGERSYSCPGPASRTKKLKLIIGVAASGVGVLLTCIIIFWFRSKRSIIKSTKFWTKKTKNEQDLEAFIRKYGPLALNRYKFLELKKMTNSFRDKLGQGGFGGVYKGKLLDGRPVAVKVLNESKGNGEEFINEVASISRTSHVNIVTLVGFCLEGQKRALIYEFMPNGSLEKFIQDGNLEKTSSHLGWEKLFQIAIGIARGLEYLHRGCNTRILHFDIKPHNILLDEDFCPKISDFGLAKLCIRNESNISMTGTRGTIGYIAPEVFSRNFGGVSHKSDVYSYGMMILEMAGGRNNTDVGVSQTSEIYFPHWIYKRLELDNDIGFLSNMTTTENEMVRKMILVGLWCIQTNPFDRPSMNKVIEMIEGNIEALKIPPKPFLCSPPRSLVEESSTTSML
ncbi:LEAF RUST 10 DISEASE-RESISTANCE LOCUS RECEPTOR-LIKE PROTEIN KINASE-like 2.4 [Quercus robur]|uniref:LEAF RUST 10 DISEASE-RESISTANCE LOCUS RECEPTOR-LIKE PROTEIN KINASE-like 2.4 n=1 Tax=Quercus robur TaxID=38942 RepID=UPI00216279D9|nr:LEAF RUST 10 DISEASE-RESISTANCE LOCUS RECEPTOR-LIKE PROTEIN KINASE-like 2.4 [Quercus robur]